MSGKQEDSGLFFFDPIKEDENNEIPKQPENDEESLTHVLKHQFITYPKRNLLQFILPFTNEIMNVLSHSNVVPEWMYNIDSPVFSDKLFVYIINCIALVGVVWNVAYVTNRQRQELMGLGAGIGFILITYLIPNLVMYNILKKMDTYTSRLVVGLGTVLVLFYLGTSWLFYMERFSSKYRSSEERRHVAVRTVSILLGTLLLIFIGNIIMCKTKYGSKLLSFFK
jgi:hypothetical protein